MALAGQPRVIPMRVASELYAELATKTDGQRRVQAADECIAPSLAEQIEEED